MNFKLIIGVLIVAAAIGLAWSYRSVSPRSTPPNSTNQPAATTPPPVETPAPAVAPPANNPLLHAPISRALARVTKKPFGIKITPQTSPVQPERFAGYHTGVDFETFPDEATADVPIYAVCEGAVRLKKYATGYGGVLVQQCRLAGQDVTVIYGHLKLASISAKVGDKLVPGATIGVLGQGGSAETDGERKHLHLSIHQGTAINILGYVQHQAELSNWLDATKYLR